MHSPQVSKERVLSFDANFVEDDVSAMLINLFVYSSIAPNFVDRERSCQYEKDFQQSKTATESPTISDFKCFLSFQTSSGVSSCLMN